MGLADLHIHTTNSWDGTCTVSAVLKRATEVGLDVIAITDHDEIKGSLEAVKLAPAYRIGVIPGCEISTAEGHLLALFIHHPIPKGLSLAETLVRTADQGGFCIAAHPSARGMNSLSPKAIWNATQDPMLGRVLLGIEVFNSGLFHLGSNRAAQKLADSLPVAQIGSSDAHISWMIGNAKTSFKGSSVQDLHRSIEARTTQAVSHSLNTRLYLLSNWIYRYLIRKAGWVSGNAGPNAPLQWVRYGQS